MHGDIQRWKREQEQLELQRKRNVQDATSGIAGIVLVFIAFVVFGLLAAYFDFARW